MKLNQEQTKHLADTLQALALGQLAVFGYVGFSGGQRLSVIISGVVLVAFEAVALGKL